MYLECVLPLDLDYSLNLPLIFSSNGTLISKSNEPSFNQDTEEEETSAIILSAGDEVVLSCAPNFFRSYPADKQLNIKCREEKTFRKFLIVQNTFLIITFRLYIQ